MELTVRTIGENSVSESRSLLDWLRAGDTAGVAATLARRPSRPEEMGLLADAVRVVFEPATVAAVGGAVATWITTRRRAVELHLRHGDRELKLTAASPRDARRVLAEIEDLLSPAPEAESGEAE